MECEVVLSVMNQKNVDEAIKRLRIADSDRCLVINQITKPMAMPKEIKNGVHRFLSYREHGLSRSRNRGLENATGDVVVLSDDDMELVRNYKSIVAKAYQAHPDADVISFDYIRANKSRKTMRAGKVGYLRSMRLSSAQLTFRRSSILRSKINFDENFGTGSRKYNWGEENIFLFDCIRAGLKIYHVPIVVRIIREDLGTTWDKSNTPGHFRQHGAIYYRMSPKFWRILVLQYVLRKRKIYSNDMSGINVYRSMVRGANEYKQEHKNA